VQESQRETLPLMPFQCPSTESTQLPRCHTLAGHSWDQHSPRKIGILYWFCLAPKISNSLTYFSHIVIISFLWVASEHLSSLERASYLEVEMPYKTSGHTAWPLTWAEKLRRSREHLLLKESFSMFWQQD
jgi:hypothetical protein